MQQKTQSSLTTQFNDMSLKSSSFFMSSEKCPNWPEMIQNTQINKYIAYATKKVLN